MCSEQLWPIFNENINPIQASMPTIGKFVFSINFYRQDFASIVYDRGKVLSKKFDSVCKTAAKSFRCIHSHIKLVHTRSHKYPVAIECVLCFKKIPSVCPQRLFRLCHHSSAWKNDNISCKYNLSMLPLETKKNKITNFAPPVSPRRSLWQHCFILD